MKNILFFILLIIIVAFSKINHYIPAQTSGLNVQDTILPKKDTLLMPVDSVAIDTLLEKPKFYYGIASFYSKSLEGSETSTQERFRHSKFTCASNRFKLNTWLRVTNISNNKSIIVRVNDRMHPRMDKKGRIVDLSIAGATKLDFIKRGVTKVKVEVVPKPIKK